MTTNFFTMLGARIAFGRNFAGATARAAAAAAGRRGTTRAAAESRESAAADGDPQPRASGNAASAAIRR